MRNVKLKLEKLVLCLISLILCACSEIRTETPPYEVLVVAHDSGGYGYEIWMSKQRLIKQEFIPVINYQNAFCNEADAKAVGTLVVERLKTRRNPSITKTDLQELEVQLTCNF